MSGYAFSLRLHSLIRYALGYQPSLPPWNATAPVREELFSVERLEQHAQTLAAAQSVTPRPAAVAPLHLRLDDNAAVLLAAYRASAAELATGRDVVPAAAWLLDNYHLVEAQISEVRGDLPPGYYRQLPKLAEGPFVGYPRVFGLAWAFVAHTDSFLDFEALRRFIAAYQRVQPLTIGELWAVAITLRIVLIENLRRLADQITAEQAARGEADALAARLIVPDGVRSTLTTDHLTRPPGPLSAPFVAQLAKRLRDQDPRTTPLLGWLQECLSAKGEDIDAVVQQAQQRQGAANVTVRNIITSMRLVSSIDWADLFESVSLVDARLCAASAFAAMDFPTRNRYRSAIEQLARCSTCSEAEVAEAALQAAQVAAAGATGAGEAERLGDPGYHLIGKGRIALEGRIGFRPPLWLRLRRGLARYGLAGYVGAILLVTTAMMVGILAGLAWRLPFDGPGDGLLLTLLALAGLVPLSELATTLVNRGIASGVSAVTLPALELAGGVPPSLRTLIAVPTLLTGEAELREQIERLEVHYLADSGGDLFYALLTDGIDADQETLPADAPLLAWAGEAVARLNRRYGPGPDPASQRFLLLHRRRVFNHGERCWMGWERKRGKLHELNRLLRGATDTTFLPGVAAVPNGVRYVITLDADTRLPRDAVRRLVGKMAHPLNRPRFAAAERRVVEGYAILQPRVTPSLPVGEEDTYYQRLFSGPGGLDPYAAAVSDIYQDLFGEGSFTGKGIYDVDAVEAALAGRVPENTLLSHDLFEGTFARAGLASDVEVVEDFPLRYDVAGKRQHRWTRGDWQLLPWLLPLSVGRGSTAGAGEEEGAISVLPAIGRFKMLDNLRRSLLAPFTLAALGLCWLLPVPEARLGILLVTVVIAAPVCLPILLAALPQRSGLHLGHHVRRLADELRLAALQVLLLLVFLPDQALRMLDAIIRTLVRLRITHRHLLEWTTAAQSMGCPRLTLAGFYRQMAAGTLLGLGLAAIALILAPVAWPLVLPFALGWLAAPALAAWLSGAPRVLAHRTPGDAEIRDLRRVARRSWRFFETFVTPTDNLLPPDNFQEDPAAVIAHRTSPTNLGLYLLATVAARDFGWAGTLQTVERLEATLKVMQKLPRFRGHFFNWYATRDLRVLEPAYVSSVDSGNLAGHLIVLANACQGWREGLLDDPRGGLGDALWLAREALGDRPAAAAAPLATLLEEIDTRLQAAWAPQEQLPLLSQLAERAAAHAGSPEDASGATELAYWVEALHRSVTGHCRDQEACVAGGTLPNVRLSRRLEALAAQARALAMAMDFTFLVDPERKLLSIGYSLADNSLDASCYDLLASEARLASLLAIAKGDVSTRHWFRLGRASTPLRGGAALISWSGSMFEYLMPSLVMRAPYGSLLEQTNRLVVERQQAYGRSLGVPWGLSESAYNARDLEFTYQYSNFGVPGLGLKRGLSADVVIAPYATGLAAMVDPRGAQRNFARLAELGAMGRYGFYEALDFTRSRLPDHDKVAIVRSFMAHHQGMTIVAIANVLQQGEMRARFHREPMIQACELLLQERMPRDVALAHPRAEEVKAAPAAIISEAHTTRRIIPSTDGAPLTHLLSNGRYAVMLTASGGGYSRWRQIAVTRWQEDATRDAWGAFVILRDLHSAAVWSPTLQPLGRAAAGPELASDVDSEQGSEVIFAEDHARFTRRTGSLTTTLEILVSGEDDSEVRRVTLTNSGRRPREIELTSYAELVLTTPAADSAHPAFAKLFVVTEYLADCDALIATRRLRDPQEPQVWAAHFAVVEGQVVAEPQYETDRARFIGRGRTVGTAAGIVDGEPLSNTVGTVLDPIFALRLQLRVAPGSVARVAFWTLVAASRPALLDLIDKHHDRHAFERAKTLAWTQAQVQLRHLDVKAGEAADFQRLAAPILYADPRFRAPAEAIRRGAGCQSGLWPLAISGDLPIVLLRIDALEDLAQVRQLLRAHEYWSMKCLGVDLVIVNERASSYVQDLQIAIETAVLSSQARPRFGEGHEQGQVRVLRADLMSLAARQLLQAVARVALLAHRGPLADQLAHLQATAPASASAYPGAWRVHRAVRMPRGARAAPNLEFFNGLGGFDRDGREYVTLLEAGRTTPAPWLNVIANPDFGCQVSAEGSGYLWAENSRENQLSPWSNDPVTDPAGEAIYVRDEDTFELWTATALPIRDGGAYLARHGFGYSRFEHQAHGIALELLHFVPLGDPLRVSRLVLKNRSGRPRRLSVTAYVEWVLGTLRAASAPHLISDRDEASGALLVHNPWSIAFPGRVAFLDLAGRQTAWTADRREFLGPGGSPQAPAALLGAATLSGAIGAGLDPCAALQCPVTLGAGETAEVVILVGQCRSVDAARALILRYRDVDLDDELSQVAEHWQRRLGAVHVTTPDRAMNIMLNGWLLYQTVACRLWARSAFYQASGAFGFRDQLQDGMALSFAAPEMTREHLLRAASRQFIAGDVQHWWLPHSGQGVRTRISDDRVWLAFATATYVASSGDAAVLDEPVAFLEGPTLDDDKVDAFFQPMIADESASLFEHCARGLDQCLTLTGEHGLPLIGGGDWNDGMNRVGAGGRGESVWLGWLLLRTLSLFVALAETRTDARDRGQDSVHDADQGHTPDSERGGVAPGRTARWRAHATMLGTALERHAWDGQWYRRATFDDGRWLGAKASEECRIDAIAQSWAVLSGAADSARAARAMASLDEHLIRGDDGLALLFWPPFDRTSHDPGYIRGYPPGLRENGGQYSHAAMWSILAFARLGQGDKAAALFALLNPINHARTAEAAERYKVEPYVVAADVYSVAPHIGRGGWTWYTGAAGWMYRAGIEGILGLCREGPWLVVAPCLPAAWPGYSATLEVAGTGYAIVVDNAARRGQGITQARLDEVALDCDGGSVRVPLDGEPHRLMLVL